jgi:glycosyltransferase involved in cell wall biosynthesis
MAIRQYHLLRAYAQWGRVHLVTFYADDDQRAAAESLKEHCEGVHAVPAGTTVGASRTRGSLPSRIIGRVRGLRPTAVAWAHSPEMTRLVTKLAEDADVVHVARLHMAAQVEPILSRRGSRVRAVLDLDDVESSARFRHLRLGQRESLLQRLHGYYDLARLWAYEMRAVRRFDRVLVCSERDRRRFGRSNVVVVPNGTCVPGTLPTRHGDGRTLMFCGLLSYAPNVDAVQFLVKAVFPHVRRAVPDARLVIVGRAPKPEIRALHDGTNVVIASDVPSVAEYYARADVAVVPLRFGGGTRIKILEAWAHGVPVVSTAVGCEGLDGVHDRHLLVADRPEDFAARCVAVMRSRDLGDRLVMEAWRLVSQKYRWEDIGAGVASDAAVLLKTSRG